MDLTTWIIFASVAIVAIASPGPAILLAISNSLNYGIKSVLLSSFGNISGLFILSSAAIFGLGAILKTSTTVFLIVKIAGAAYLIYLGVRQWRSKTNLFVSHSEESDGLVKKMSRKRKSLYLEGFLIAITNPKAILFFTALFPQFISLKSDLAPQFLIMTFTFMGMSFLALSTYGLLASKAKQWFSTSRRVKWFNRIIGGLFVVIGFGLLQLRATRVNG